MEQSPSEANLFSARQEIPLILWNLNVHYRIHKCPPPVLILKQIDPIHAPISHLLKINPNIILPSTPGSSRWSFSLWIPHKTLYTPLLSPPNTSYISHPSHFSRFDHPKNNEWGVQTIKLLLL